RRATFGLTNVKWKRTLKPRAGAGAGGGGGAEDALSPPPSTFPSPLKVGVRLFWILAAAWLAACLASSFFFFNQSIARHQAPTCCFRGKASIDHHSVLMASLCDSPPAAQVAATSALIRDGTHRIPDALLRERGGHGAATGVRPAYTFGFFSECAARDAGAYCVGNQLVYSMGCFFLLTGLLSCAVARGCENVCCLALVHIPFYLAMLFASLFIPNSFFDDYADVARVASAAFMIIQIIIILDYAYNLRDYILDKMDEAERDEDARQALLDTRSGSGSSSANAKTIRRDVQALCGVRLEHRVPLDHDPVVHRAHRHERCEMAPCDDCVVSLSVALTLVWWSQHAAMSWVSAGLLPAAAFTGYAVFLCYQAVHSNPDPTCSSLDPSTIQHQTKSVALNAALAAFTITWTSWRISITKTNLFTLSSSASSEQEEAEADDKEREAAERDVESGRAVLSGKDEVVVPDYQFHALMFLATFYMAMVITNWGSSNGLVSEDDELVTMWVKICSQWVAIALFLWTLIAPSMFPDRDFGV
ncbi:hypothetical protein PybrP1_000032, partial [[Pythium] brassicae (nom. inval.)]